MGAMDVRVDDRRRVAKVTRGSFRLRMVKGVPAQGVYGFERSATIGRGDENDVVLADPSVSRAHAEIETDAAGPLVRDLDSTNGTSVNGRRDRAERLHDGDELSFGNTRMRFEAAAAETMNFDVAHAYRDAGNHGGAARRRRRRRFVPTCARRPRSAGTFRSQCELEIVEIGNVRRAGRSDADGHRARRFGDRVARSRSQPASRAHREPRRNRLS